MIAFIVSIVVTLVLFGAVIIVAWKRPVGKRLTWGEAFIAAMWVFALMVMAYGVVPDRWLRWADGELGWRADKVGIPTGPLPWNKQHLMFKHGIHIPFTGGHWYGTKGRINITAQTIRDIIETTIYIVAFAGQLIAWWWWQRRPRKAQRKQQAAITAESAYGRPLQKPKPAEA